MLVADTNEVATSATLGGKETIAFGISDDQIGRASCRERV